MSTTEVTLLWLYGLIVAIWPIRYLVLKHILGKVQFLTPDSPSLAQADPPLVSAVIPAKDEEAVLADCLASVCRQRYPRLEIIVIDDRSTDRTGAIASEYAGRDPRLRVLTNDHLPAGWTGKTHVLHQAVQQAHGRWLWFLDADTNHAPEFLGVMLEYARIHRAALVSLLPELRCETFWEQLVQPLGGIVLMQSFPLHRVNDDRFEAGLRQRPVDPGRALGLRGSRRPCGGPRSIRRGHRPGRPGSRRWDCQSGRYWCETW